MLGKNPFKHLGRGSGIALLAWLSVAGPCSTRAQPGQNAGPSLTTSVTIRQMQERPVFGQAFTIVEIGLEMRPIPAGTFLMGSPEDEPGHMNSEAQHRVRISKPFWLGRTVVTYRAWKIIMGTDLLAQVAKIHPDAPNPQHYLGKTDDNVAMYYVNWDEAMAFCRKLTDHARAAGLLPEGYEYTLPTEAQWEYACRAGTTTATYAGPIRILGDFNAPVLNDIAWFAGNSNQGYQGAGWYIQGLTTQPNAVNLAGPRDVALKQPNAWGLYDMLGNVWQWCSDWFGAYDTSEEVAVDPVGPDSGDIHVHRGGSWCSYAASCRAASRSRNVPGDRFYNLGFRVALAPRLASP